MVASTSQIEIWPTIDEFELAAAQTIIAIMTAALRERGRCLIALSGGNTPRGVYRRLRDLLQTQPIDLSNIHFIFTDERMVAPDDPDSNFGMARHEFISHLHIPSKNVHRIKGEIKADAAAHEYERELQPVFKLFSRRCDLTLLGVGENGHTASLFPKTKILREKQKTVRAVYLRSLTGWRVTLTLPVINRSRGVLFLVAGKKKAAIVGKIFANDKSREDLPATLVRPHPGTLTWMLDAKAASQVLKRTPHKK